MRLIGHAPLAILLLAVQSPHAQSVLLKPTDRRTVAQPSAATVSVNYATEDRRNAVVNADQQSGGDIGAKINAAVGACEGQGIICNIVAQNGGTISTPPELPVGFSLTFNPAAQYRLATNWVIDHRSTTFNFNGAHFEFSLTNGSSAFYIGKKDVSVVDISGTTVTWMSGSRFGNIDAGDQIQIDTNSFGPAGANVASVNSPTQLSLTASPGAFTNARMLVYMDSNTALGPYPGRNVVIKDLVLDGNGKSTAMTVELADGIALYNFTANLFTKGFCLLLKGAINGNYYNTHCNDDGFGVDLDQNTIGGFWVSTSNANRFFGLDLDGSSAATGKAITFNGASGNILYGVHAEGERNHTVAAFSPITSTGYSRNLNASANLLQVSDFESNGDNTAGSQDIRVDAGSRSNTIEGGSFTSTYTGTGSGFGTQHGIVIAGSAIDTVIRDTSFLDNYSISYAFQAGATGFVENVNTVGARNPPANVWDSAGGIAAPAVDSHSYSVNGKAGFTGTKTVGACTFAISGGIITNVTGC